ncbi:Splicing factor 3A subunit 3 [Lunasporangiospora selenospora]|uniref:Splicing factor 3A subunit 3 n=1 Tax=Lunasporangiospora selenospora TaxID=979761 RepID=A0A9P6G2W5_9FUNG|nr:Splicing factor 3A subunit 3 [Lunasporangiospora selenospora]
MDSVLETQRRLHEEIDRLEQAIVVQFMENPKTLKDHLLQEHAVNVYMERITSRSTELSAIYKDEDETRKKEMDALSGANEFSEFYSRLKKIKSHHHRFPNEEVEPMELEFMDHKPTMTQIQALEDMFSGEESGGRYLDLHEVHDQYMNLTNLEGTNYLGYLSEFTKFQEIDKKTKNAAYQKYLDSLRSYLEGYIGRVKPLTNIVEIKRDAQTEFEVKYEQGELPGWPKVAQEDAPSTDLFCVACKKQYTKDTVYNAHLTSKKHIKAAAQLAAENGGASGTAGEGGSASVAEIQSKVLEQAEKTNPERKMAWSEYLIKEYADTLKQQIEDTRENVERQQTLTGRERDLELETEQIELDESDSEDEEKVYNPLKLPLGWDGKPIPYWLYKLHGLGVEYSCEICGNYVYKGRKAFDKHFQEWRHAHGMRCLGISNTRQFHEIVRIEDALALWKRIKGAKPEGSKRDQIEEFEDSEGNVFNKKTYEDLKRQGLI